MEVTRLNETAQQTEQRQLTDSQAHQRARQDETDEQTQHRQVQQRQIQTNVRARPARTHNVARQRIDPANPPTPFSAGTMSVICRHCDALSFPSEKFNCCHDGKVSIDIPLYPAELQALFEAETPVAINFRRNIRKYNTSFSFASMQCNLTGAPPGIFKICGQMYSSAAGLFPPNGQPPTFNQLYIYQGDVANNLRLRNHYTDGCTTEVMEIINSVIETINPYAYAYKTMAQKYNEQVALAASEGRNTPSEVRMHLRTGPDRRRYNLPGQNEVAAIFLADDGAPSEPPDIVVYTNQNHLRRISMLSPNSDPMCYPLLFPDGHSGWYPGIPHVGENRTSVRNRVTPLQYAAYHWADRTGIFNPQLRAGFLSQQKMVSDYVKVESLRLKHQRERQTDLRVESYQGLHDYVHQPDPDLQRNNPGRPFILPSTFIGSPRQMAESYQDAMAIVRKYGKPDLFVTFTCNPTWPEFSASLQPGQSPQDRPDLISRIFHLYFQEFLHDLYVGQILGKLDSYIYVIEFQKRGYPHAHLLLHLSDEDKLRSSQDIDSIISAEIPDPNVYPELHAKVSKMMMHGPCGQLNPNNVCMHDGQCAKKFPKVFSDSTVPSIGGYPTYKRADNGRTVHVRNQDLDNRWVVPYNPYLLRKYNAHINVESYSSVQSVKYVYKYVYKGFDCASVDIQSDELKHFVDGRYVSPPDAAWRLLEYKTQARSHSVERLPIHLPDMQSVFFLPGEHDAALDRALNQDTKLTAWFKLNATDPEANQHLYADIPIHYCWNTKANRNSANGQSNDLPVVDDGNDGNDVVDDGNDEGEGLGDENDSVQSLAGDDDDHSICTIEVDDDIFINDVYDGLSNGDMEDEDDHSICTMDVDDGMLINDVYDGLSNGNSQDMEVDVDDDGNDVEWNDDRVCDDNADQYNRQDEFDVAQLNSEDFDLPIDVLEGDDDGVGDVDEGNDHVGDVTIAEGDVLNEEDDTVDGQAYRQGNTSSRSRAHWKRRQRSRKIVTRLSHVSPRDTERYCLRMLLLNVPSATSFEHLRTVDGIVCGTYREACFLRNLLDSDQANEETLQEACLHEMPSQLRQLFAHMLLYCDISDPYTLWFTIHEQLMEDFIRAGDSEVVSKQKSLLDIQRHLSSSGKSLKHFDLDLPEVTDGVLADAQYDIEAESELADNLYPTLNPEQRLAADAITDAILSPDPSKPNLFFLDGPGGSGKTYTYNYLVHKVKSLGKRISCSALTGIAATLLIDGKTTHSTFKVPVPCFGNSACTLSSTDAYATILKNIDCFVIDEISNMSKDIFHVIDRLFRYITENPNVPFGGKVFVLGGDFRQTLPVVRRASVTAILENCVLRSPIWAEHVVSFQFSANMRVNADEASFKEFLLELGEGKLQLRNSHPFEDCITIPSKFVLENDIVDFVFPFSPETNFDEFKHHAILSPTNRQINLINKQVLDRLPSHPKTYFAIDSIVRDGKISVQQEESYPVEFLNSLTLSGIPPHTLALKVGAPIMLLRNIDTSKGLTNGTRLMVKHLRDKYIDAEVLTGSSIGSRVIITRMPLIPSDTDLPFTLCRKQFPIRLAYAITINKAQGQTFDRIGILLDRPCFAHGQLYVAMSRARSEEGVKIIIVGGSSDQGKHRGCFYTKNIVHKDVLTSR